MHETTVATAINAVQKESEYKFLQLNPGYQF